MSLYIGKTINSAIIHVTNGITALYSMATNSAIGNTTFHSNSEYIEVKLLSSSRGTYRTYPGDSYNTFYWNVPSYTYPNYWYSFSIILFMVFGIFGITGNEYSSDINFMFMGFIVVETNPGPIDGPPVIAIFEGDDGVTCIPGDNTGPHDYWNNLTKSSQITKLVTTSGLGNGTMHFYQVGVAKNRSTSKVIQITKNIFKIGNFDIGNTSFLSLGVVNSVDKVFNISGLGAVQIINSKLGSQLREGVGIANNNIAFKFNGSYHSMFSSAIRSVVKVISHGTSSGSSIRLYPRSSNSLFIIKSYRGYTFLAKQGMNTITIPISWNALHGQVNLIPIKASSYSGSNVFSDPYSTTIDWVELG